MGLFQADLLKLFVEKVQAEAAQQQIGGRIVGQGDHQPAQGADIHCYLSGEEIQRAAGGQLIFLPAEKLF